MTTGQASAVGTARRLSPARFLVAGGMSGLLSAAAAGGVDRFSGPPLCEPQDNAFSCLGTMATLSLVSLLGLVLAWAGLWRWAGSPWPWAVSLRGMPLVLGGLVVLVVGASADGLRTVAFNLGGAAENDVHTAVLVLLWLACLSAAALTGAALWVSGRRRRAALLVPALAVAMVGADALAAVGVLSYQTWRIRSVAAHPYGLLGPDLTLLATGVERGALTLEYRTPGGQDVELTVSDRPDSLDLTAPCSPAVRTLFDQVRACEQVESSLPGAVVWATPTSGPDATRQALVVVAVPDALVVLSLVDIGVTSADLLPRVPQLHRTGAVTLLRSAEESVDIR